MAAITLDYINTMAAVHSAIPKETTRALGTAASPLSPFFPFGQLFAALLLALGAASAPGRSQKWAQSDHPHEN